MQCFVFFPTPFGLPLSRAWDAVKLTPPRAWRDQAWGQWLPPVPACGTTLERLRRGYSKGPSATLFVGGLQELKTMAASPLCGWLSGLIMRGSLIAAMVGAPSLPTECSGGAETGLATSGEPVQ